MSCLSILAADHNGRPKDKGAAISLARMMAGSQQASEMEMEMSCGKMMMLMMMASRPAANGDKSAAAAEQHNSPGLGSGGGNGDLGVKQQQQRGTHPAALAKGLGSALFVLESLEAADQLVAAQTGAAGELELELGATPLGERPNGERPADEHSGGHAIETSDSQHDGPLAAQLGHCSAPKLSLRDQKAPPAPKGEQRADRVHYGDTMSRQSSQSSGANAQGASPTTSAAKTDAELESTKASSSGNKSGASVQQVAMMHRQRARLGPVWRQRSSSGRATTQSFTANNHHHMDEPQMIRYLGSSVQVRSEQKATKVLGLVFFTFLICWSPFFLINFAHGFLKREQLAHYISDQMMTTFLWLGYISSTINPVIYTVFNRNFRKAFRQLILCQGPVLRGLRRTDTGFMATFHGHANSKHQRHFSRASDLRRSYSKTTANYNALQQTTNQNSSANCHPTINTQCQSDISTSNLAKQSLGSTRAVDTDQ